MQIPTSADIYIEMDGKKVAAVQSYRALSKRQSRAIEAFGESEPIATIAGQRVHTVELSRLYITVDAADEGVNFHDMENFSLIIVKPDRKIIYTGCRWSDVAEAGDLGEMVIERVTVVATKRLETAR